MPIPIEMTAAAAGMEHASLVRWLKSEGDDVATGEVIAEVETDKAVMEMEAPGAGVLGRIDVPGGTDEVAVGAVIGYLLQPGEDSGALPAALEVAGAPEDAAPAAPPAPETAHSASTQAPGAEEGSPSRSDERRRVSPLARRLAAERGVELADLVGSGPHGRIVRIDVEQAAAAAPASQPLPGSQTSSLIPHSGMRKTIARRLTESKQQVPHFYLSIDCAMEKVLDLRHELNRLGETEREPWRLSVNDFIVRAAAKALEAVPEVNVSWQENGLLRYADADVCVAVATEGGLLTPVVRHAGRRDMVGLSREIAELAARARAGELSPHEYQAGSFTVSNLGMYGISDFAAIINPPQAAILAAGAVRSEPVVRNDAVVAGLIMTLTLSADHRSIDGADAARFLAALRDRLHDPLSLLV